MSRVIVASASPGEIRAAAIENGLLIDYAIERPGAPAGVGDLYRGRVMCRVPFLAGAFVALGEAEGFLPDTQGGLHVTEGASIGARVVRAPQAGKGPRLSGRLTDEEQALIGTGPPALVRRGPGAIARLVTLHPGAPALVDDPALASRLRGMTGLSVSVHADAMDDAIEAQIEALAEPSVTLAGGMLMHVHPTPALVAIDLDSGAATSTKVAKIAAQSALNRVALPAIARQIRLRNLSGAIVLDLAGLSLRRRGPLGRDLAAALADDPLHPKFLGFSALGFAEILRPRMHAPLHELLSGPHAAGLAGLRDLVRAATGAPACRFVLKAAPAVAAAITTDPIALADVARRTGRALELASCPSLAPEAWILERRDG